jgi:formamidopyrimidine-DNA glycosylase
MAISLCRITNLILKDDFFVIKEEMMPELPEVETLCRQLNAILPGKKILAVEILDPRLGEREGEGLTGRKIEAVHRQGKCIRLEIGKRGRLSVMSPEKRSGKVKPTAQRAGLPGKEEACFLLRHYSPPTGRDFRIALPVKKSQMDKGFTAELHLRMTGRLLWQTDGASLPPYTRLVMTFSAGKLLLIDPRRFATFHVRSEEAALPPLANPLEGMPASRLGEIAGMRRLPVKPFLMDQRFIAGIGNIYACEILHHACVDPRRPSGSLSANEWWKVEQAAAVILPRAVACRGTTVSDWRDLFGNSGENQEHLKVYSRKGKSCRRCGGKIACTKLGGRGTWFCPACQK